MCCSYLFCSHSLCLSFRFEARSTESRRGEKRLIFQYVIFHFPVNKCVCTSLFCCVCVINTGVTDSIFLTAFASHEKKKEKIPTTAMPQRVSVHRLTSRQSVLDALIHQTYTHNNPPPSLPSSLSPLQHLHRSNVKLHGGLQVSNPGQAIP